MYVNTPMPNRGESRSLTGAAIIALNAAGARQRERRVPVTPESLSGPRYGPGHRYGTATKELGTLNASAETTMPARVDVAIIGAGVVGCSIAYQLAKRGRQVAVFDKRGICSGASGRNGGMTGTGSALHSAAGDAVYALTTHNFFMLQDELNRELDDDFSLMVTGGVDIAMNDEQANYLQAAVETQRQHGIDVEWLDGDQARDMIPALSEHALGAELKRESGHLWPFQLVHALANGARHYSATFHTHTPVTSIVTGNGEVKGIETERGTVETGTVVVATNAWTGELLPDLPAGAIVPARGQILVTQPAGPILPMPFSTNYDKEYGRQTHSGQILCGGFRRLDTGEGLGQLTEDVHPAAVGGIANCLATIFPRLADLRVVRCWAGLMGFTADGLPLIGSYGEHAGLFVAAGFNGGGFSWGPAVGKAMAQLINNGRSTLDLDPFNPDRFHEAGTAWDNPFTAGEKNNPRKLSIDA
jgi:sarcosine oxidase, subunit beta